MSTFFKRLHLSGTRGPVSTRRLRRGGFTLVELLVVLAIMTILTAVILFQHKQFDSSTLLRSLAYSVALSVRQAQVYGTSVRQFGTAAGSFNYSYGVYFTAGDASHYYLFADVNGNKAYDSAPTDEKINRYTLGSGYTITKFCATVVAGGTLGPHCSNDGSPISSLTVYFKRPNPDAKFSTNIPGETYSDAYIQIVGPTGGTATRAITITSTGQISVGTLGS